MRLIAGLGNPGTKYKNTRHNIGFRVTDELVSKYNSKFRRSLFKKCKQANLSILGEDIAVIQPLTYMNLSGGCIVNFCKSFPHKADSPSAKKLNLKDILVVCDDINLPFGKIRIRASGSAGGHNGLDSIINTLGSDDFSRLRIGIKQQQDQDIENLAQYVLSEFTISEQKETEEVIKKAVSICEAWIKDGIDTAMNRYNSNDKEVLS